MEKALHCRAMSLNSSFQFILLRYIKCIGSIKKKKRKCMKTDKDNAYVVFKQCNALQFSGAFVFITAGVVGYAFCFLAYSCSQQELQPWLPLFSNTKLFFDHSAISIHSYKMKSVYGECKCFTNSKDSIKPLMQCTHHRRNVYVKVP